MKRLLRNTVLALTGLVLIVAVAGYLALRGSLPRRSGNAEIATLSAATQLEFDALGIPRIRAETLTDAFAAQGFVHAQDRYFQMDLTRRSAAGELAALVGAAAIGFDAGRRPAQLRERARAMLGRLPQRHREWIEAYTGGVNAGLADLGVRPPEYLLLRQRPAPWLAEDTLLVALALYTMLSNNDSYELNNAALRENLSADTFEFVTPMTARADRPLAARDDADVTGGYEPAEVPGPDQLDLRASRYDGSLNFVRQPLSPAGSNNWAVSYASGNAGGNALLANDPHLQLRIPNVFHRAELYWDDGLLRGVGIAGLPGILLGANDTVGWGATVSYADQADYIVVEIDPSDATRYLTPEGAEAFDVTLEYIAVAGREEPVELQIRSTRWGPVAAEDPAGTPLALRATWLQDDGFDLGMLDLVFAKNAAEAVATLRNWRGPSLNWMTADSEGRIGWTINGPIPLRRNYDGDVPERWSSGDFGWRGEVDLPWTVSADEDYLYSANNRQLTMPYARLLSRFSLHPQRALTIADALESGRVTDESSSLSLQLDTRVAAYDRMRDIVLEIVPADEATSTLANARTQIAQWDGNANVSSIALPLLERFYDHALERILGTVLLPVREAAPGFVYRWPLADEVMQRILDERPAHFLPDGFATWQAYLRDILERSLAANTPTRWGEVNRLAIAHPLAAVPGLASLLNWPNPELPGNTYSLRVAQPNFGAVFRLNLRPGSPETGILQFAGGQSGHFLSPHYADQLDDWVNGTPTPFLAGPTQYHYTLQPASDGQ